MRLAPLRHFAAATFIESADTGRIVVARLDDGKVVQVLRPASATRVPPIAMRVPDGSLLVQECAPPPPAGFRRAPRTRPRGETSRWRPAPGMGISAGCTSSTATRRGCRRTRPFPTRCPRVRNRTCSRTRPCELTVDGNTISARGDLALVGVGAAGQVWLYDGQTVRLVGTPGYGTTATW